MAAPTQRTLTCPVCQRPFDAAVRTNAPFCSARCKTVDLGNWLGGAYAVPAGPADDEEGDGAPDLSALVDDDE